MGKVQFDNGRLFSKYDRGLYEIQNDAFVLIVTPLIPKLMLRFESLCLANLHLMLMPFVCCFFYIKHRKPLQGPCKTHDFDFYGGGLFL